MKQILQGIPFKFGWDVFRDFKRENPVEGWQPKGFNGEVEMRDSAFRVLLGEGRSVVGRVRGQRMSLVQKPLVLPWAVAKGPDVLSCLYRCRKML